ncbi:hypothetical protein Tco_1061128 [Tanacetum coccineum]
MAELVAAAGAPKVTKGAPNVDEGDQVVSAPIKASQPPPAAGPARTIAQRINRLEEDVHGMRGALGKQREVFDSMACDFSRFTTWTVIGLSYVRRTRRSTYDASTSSPQQPDP